MTKFKKSPKAAEKEIKMQDFIEGASERLVKPLENTKDSTQRTFLLKINAQEHETLRRIAEKEDRSMQWILRKLSCDAIREKAHQLNIDTNQI